ncbi:MAG: monovalent cation/H+ antiporter complex subunit F [Kiloniellaceae bacterium]
MMFAAATAAILVTMGLALARALLGPTIYDRVLAVNMFGTKTMLLIAVLGFLTGRPDFLDISLVYALINFIGTIAVLKFLKFGDLGTPGDGESETER